MWTLNDVAFICVVKEAFSYYDEGRTGDDDQWYWRHMVDGTQILRRIAVDYPQPDGDITGEEQLLTKLPWFRQYLTTGRSELSHIFNDILNDVVRDAAFRQQTLDIQLDTNEMEYAINGMSASDIFENLTEYRTADGTLHREDGPAVVHDGDEEWWFNGTRHRGGDLPAIVRYNGDSWWYTNGKLHRGGDLPAFVSTNGCLEWYSFGRLHRDGDLPATVDENGDREWWVNGFLHREDGLPAIDYTNGDQVWYTRGMRHREGGLPAISYFNDDQTVDQEWWVNGERHREDGPAVELSDGTQTYFLNNRLLSEEEFIVYSDFCQRMRAKVRCRAQKKIYFWWIPICYRQDRESGTRMCKKSYESYVEMINS